MNLPPETEEILVLLEERTQDGRLDWKDVGFDTRLASLQKFSVRLRALEGFAQGLHLVVLDDQGRTVEDFYFYAGEDTGSYNRVKGIWDAITKRRGKAMAEFREELRSL